MNPLLYVRIGIAAVVLAVLGWAGFIVHGWHRDAGRMAAAEADRDAIKAQAAQTIASLQESIVAAQAASQGYQNELSTLRAAARPVPAVRVCKPAGGSVPAVAAAARRPDAAGPPAGVVPGAVGGDSGVSRDIGPDLAALTDEADRCSAQLRGLQAWVQATR